MNLNSIKLHKRGSAQTNKWIVLAVIMAVALTNYGDRFLMAGLAQPIKESFGISDGALGLLMGPAFALLYTVFAIPAARLADKYSRVAIIGLGCAFWSGFTILSGSANGPWMLAIARVGVGIGEAAYQAPAAALIASYFPVEQRGKALAIMGMAIYLGQLIGFGGGPAIAQEYGWRAAFHTLGFAGLIVAVIALVVIREPEREQILNAEPLPPFMATMRNLWAVPSMRLISAVLAFGTMSGVAFGLWGPTLFERAYGLTTRDAGTTFALVFALPGLFGMFAFGALSDRLSRRYAAAPLMLTAVSLAGTTTGILCVVWTDDIALARIIAVPAGVLGGGWSVGVFTALQYLLPNAQRATGTAMVMLVGGMFGSVLGPFAAGHLSDLMTGGSANAWGLRVGLTAALPLAYIGSWCAWRAKHTLEADHDRLKQA